MPQGRRAPRFWMRVPHSAIGGRPQILLHYGHGLFGLGSEIRAEYMGEWCDREGMIVFSASMTGKPYNSVFGLPLDGFIHLTCPHYWRFGAADETEEQFVQRLAPERLAGGHHHRVRRGPARFAPPRHGPGG